MIDVVDPFLDTTAVHMCAAVGKAKNLLGYADEALESLEHTRSVISSMKDLARWQRLWAKKLQCSQVRAPYDQGWFDSLGEGDFVAELCSRWYVDHVVNVDSRRRRPAIYDCCEVYALRKSWKSLIACAGDGETFDKVNVVRQIVSQQR